MGGPRAHTRAALGRFLSPSEDHKLVLAGAWEGMHTQLGLPQRSETSLGNLKLGSSPGE